MTETSKGKTTDGDDELNGWKSSAISDPPYIDAGPRRVRGIARSGVVSFLLVT